MVNFRVRLKFKDRASASIYFWAVVGSESWLVLCLD
jgi:hypothetical protein